MMQGRPRRLVVRGVRSTDEMMMVLRFTSKRGSLSTPLPLLGSDKSSVASERGFLNSWPRCSVCVPVFDLERDGRSNTKRSPEIRGPPLCLKKQVALMLQAKLLHR